MNSGVLLDASALLCALNDEPGAAVVELHLHGAFISAVNLSEVAAKLSDFGMSAAEWRARLRELPITIIPFDEPIALEAGALREATKAFGLSLGDRACLATAGARETSVLTADRAWRKLANPLSLDIEFVR